MSTRSQILLPPALPFVRTALTSLPRLGTALGALPLGWPAFGTPIVTVHRREVRRIGPDVSLEEIVLAEIDKPGTLLSLARRCADARVWALLFAGPDVPRGAVAEASAFSERVVVLEYSRHQLNPRWGNEAGKAADLLVRKLTDEALRAHWQGLVDGFLNAMRALDPEATVPTPAPTRKVAGEQRDTLFATFLHLHAATVEGLWWHGHQLVTKALDICRQTLCHLRERRPPGLEAACRPAVMHVPVPEMVGGTAVGGWRAARDAELAAARACAAEALHVLGQLATDSRARALVERIPIQTTHAAAKVWVAREVRREERSLRRAAEVLGIGRPRLRRLLEHACAASAGDARIT